MTVLTLENISKSYGVKVLFNGLSLSIQEEDKIGLIGINGTGKTTLLRIIAGAETSETGVIHYMKGMTIEYLSQNPPFDENATVFEQIFKGSSEAVTLIRNYEKTLNALDADPENSKLQETLMKLTNDIKAKDLWDYESQVKIILTKLGITTFDQKMGELSGGQKKRVFLAAALIAPCDLLILDEPTNHMDNDTIDWLEKYLMNRKGALLMVTHDRYFLDRVVNRTVELDGGVLYSYPGNYSLFVEKKLERQQQETANERKRLNLYRTELEWMRRGARARTTKQKARIQRFDELENSKKELEDTNIQINVGHSRLGNKTVELSHVTKGFGGPALIKDFSYIVLRDDRIGIIGDNGMGKSTLLNLITGKLTPDSGSIDIGSTVKIGYFSQESEDMDTNQRAIDYIKDTVEYVTTADGIRISASQLMETFLFTGDMQWTPILRLSGGERRRLYLLKILISEPNILILDEPTNDLDVDTLKVLENYLDDFNGAVISVSHDRYFLDRTCQKIFTFEGHGRITEYPGNYSDYLLKKPQEVTTPVVKESKKEVERAERPQKPKFTFNEKLEFEKIDQVIEALEGKLEKVEQAIGLCTTDFVKLQELLSDKEKIEEELLEKMERQEYLYGIDEAIRNWKG